MNKLIKSFLSADFDDIELINEKYLILRVSYFNHVLTEEEYSNIELVCYSDTKGNESKIKLFETIESQFISLYKLLYELSEGKVIIYIEGVSFIIQSHDEYNNFIINAMKENPLCEVLFPTLNFFSITGYDFTHEFFILKENDNQIDTIEKITNIVSQVGLNIIKN